MPSTTQTFCTTLTREWAEFVADIDISVEIVAWHEGSPELGAARVTEDAPIYHGIERTGRFLFREHDVIELTDAETRFVEERATEYFQRTAREYREGVDEGHEMDDFDIIVQFAPAEDYDQRVSEAA